LFVTLRSGPAGRGSGAGSDHGRAVQVDPIEPKLKAPGTQRLNLKCGKLPSILLQFCFQIQLAPLHHAAREGPGPEPRLLRGQAGQGLAHVVPMPSTLITLGFQCASPGFRDSPAEPTDHFQGLLELFNPQHWTT